MRELLPSMRVDDVHVSFATPVGPIIGLAGVTLTVPEGGTLCIVGESGSGKSITARAMLNQLPRAARLDGGAVWLRRKSGEETHLSALPPTGRAMGDIRGREIGFISQEPMAALSPVHTIGDHMLETIGLHLGLRGQPARNRAIEMLARVGIPRPADRLRAYPFEFSGGMRQRVCIALALVCEPRVLIADEPTTALDVTTQANILDLIADLQAESGMSVVFITHDLGVVAQIADEVAVMYLGHVVESGTVFQIFEQPAHPYTKALLASVPRHHGDSPPGRLASIRGMVPSAFDRPAGCPFHPRCDEAQALCTTGAAPTSRFVGHGHATSCLLRAAVTP